MLGRDRAGAEDYYWASDKSGRRIGPLGRRVARRLQLAKILHYHEIAHLVVGLSVEQILPVR